MSALVSDALSSHHPVVALESTIITHGMPFPQNLETTLQVEELIKKEVQDGSFCYIYFLVDNTVGFRLRSIFPLEFWLGRI